jgi:hypothetical protein
MMKVDLNASASQVQNCIYFKQYLNGAFFKQRILSFTGIPQWFARWIERE